MAGPRTQGVQNPVGTWMADLRGGRESPGMKGGVRGKGGLIWSAQHFADGNIKRLISFLQMLHWLNIERRRETG